MGLRDYVIMLFLLDTGVRLSELVGIKLVDLKLAENELIITEAKKEVSKEGFLSLLGPRILLKNNFG